MELGSQAVDEYLEENEALIRAAAGAQQNGNVRAALCYSLRLQQNLLYLGMQADRFGEPSPNPPLRREDAAAAQPAAPRGHQPKSEPHEAAVPGMHAAPSHS